MKFRILSLFLGLFAALPPCALALDPSEQTRLEKLDQELRAAEQSLVESIGPLSSPSNTSLLERRPAASPAGLDTQLSELKEQEQIIMASLRIDDNVKTSISGSRKAAPSTMSQDSLADQIERLGHEQAKLSTSLTSNMKISKDLESDTARLNARVAELVGKSDNSQAIPGAVEPLQEAEISYVPRADYKPNELEPRIGLQEVSLLSGPGADYSILGSVYQNQKVNIDTRESTWYRVSLENGKRGWLPTNAVMFEPAKLPPGASTVQVRGYSPFARLP